MVNKGSAVAGVGGFAAGVVTGALVSLMSTQGTGAVALIDTPSGYAAPSYQFASGSTVEITVFYATPIGSDVVPTGITGYYSSSPNGPYSPGQSFTWDASSIGMSFTVDYGSISSSQSTYVYYVVSLSNNTSVKTNTLFVQVS